MSPARREKGGNLRLQLLGVSRRWRWCLIELPEDRQQNGFGCRPGQLRISLLQAIEDNFDVRVHARQATSGVGRRASNALVKHWLPPA